MHIYILHIMTMISEVRRWAGFTVYLAFSAIHLHWSCIICHNFAFLASFILFLHIYIFYSSNSVSSFAVADAWVIDSSQPIKRPISWPGPYFIPTLISPRPRQMNFFSLIQCFWKWNSPTTRYPVGRLVYLLQFPKKAWNFTSLLLSEQFYFLWLEF